MAAEMALPPAEGRKEAEVDPVELVVTTVGLGLLEAVVGVLAVKEAVVVVVIVAAVLVLVLGSATMLEMEAAEAQRALPLPMRESCHSSHRSHLRAGTTCATDVPREEAGAR
eukprot:7386094-Prymnesium_polylepis.1